MPTYDYANLRGLEGKRVRLISTEGEIADAVIDTVFEEEKDLSYRVLSTNQPERYAGGKPRGLNVIPWEFIAEIEPAERP